MAAKKPAAAKKKPASKRKLNPAFLKPLTPSTALAEIVGAAPLPRQKVTSKVWDYIHKHGLQDTKDKRKINTDDKLAAVFGGKKSVTMFEMPKYWNKHLT